MKLLTGLINLLIGLIILFLSYFTPIFTYATIYVVFQRAVIALLGLGFFFTGIILMVFGLNKNKEE
jgi:hypothetical protein